MIPHHLHVFLIELVRFCGGVGDLEIAYHRPIYAWLTMLNTFGVVLFYDSNEHIDSLT